MTLNRLHIAVAISIGLHLAAYGVWQQRSQHIEISAEPPGQNFQVSIIETLTNANSVKTDTQKQSDPKPHRESVPTSTTQPRRLNASAKNNSTRPTADKTNIQPEQTARPEQESDTSITLVRSQSPTPMPVAATQNTTTKFAILSNNMRKELNTEFKARFKYPMLARKRGWQGEVIIALNINRLGRIDEIAVKKSSGYRVLDANAIQTFREIGAVSSELQSRLNQSHQLDIPIIYKLTGS